MRAFLLHQVPDRIYEIGVAYSMRQLRNLASIIYIRRLFVTVKTACRACSSVGIVTHAAINVNVFFSQNDISWDCIVEIKTYHPSDHRRNLCNSAVEIA